MSAFGNRWWVVFASICALLVGAGSVHIFTFGVFLGPVTKELGVGRGLLSSGLVFASGLNAIGCVPLGWALHRWGVRRVLLPGIVLYAAGVAGWATMSASPVSIYTAFILAGLFGCIGSPVPYGAALSMWFDRQRGLAIGVAMAGVGLGIFIVPRIAFWLIQALGWRFAYVGLAIVVLLLAWVPVALFVREPTAQDRARQADVAVPDGSLPGMSLAQAMASWRFWALTVAFFLAIAAVNGILTQVVALLTDRGFNRSDAVGAVQLAGIAVILGRMLSGWCLDRFPGTVVAIVIFIIPMIGLAVLASHAGGFMPYLGTILCGLGVGAEVDLMAFFVSRYFGLKAYGKVYGVMFAFFAAANGIGPTIAGTIFDRYHTYGPAFLIFEAALVLTCLLLAPLGPYPYPARQRQASAGAQQAAA